LQAFLQQILPRSEGFPPLPWPKLEGAWWDYSHPVWRAVDMAVHDYIADLRARSAQ
jgi:hypothetical protein